MFELLIATKNAGKIREIEELLANVPIKLRTLREFPNIVEPEETGATFAENAILKADYYARKTGIPALADDSGLEVAALDGAPGIYSARYAGENATDEERITRLLDELKETKNKNRQARFVCAMAIVNIDGTTECLKEGVCLGQITNSRVGKNGFGYDPIFIPEGFLETFGEINSETKQKISHRALAVSKIVGFLHDFIVV